MGNSEINPVVVDHTVAAHVACELYGERYGIDWIWHHDGIGLLHPQNAIDALNNQISDTRSAFENLRIAASQFQSDRDEANRKLSVAVAEGKALVADAERYRKIEALAAGTPEQWLPVEDAAFASHWGNARNFSLNIDAIDAASTKNKEQTNG